jgi:hypothetical protein
VSDWLVLVVLAVLLVVAGLLCLLRYRKTRKVIWAELTAALWLFAIMMLFG